jgi:hypothetical protein
MAKTWQQKFDNGQEPIVKTVNRPVGGMAPGDRMLISSPAEIDEYIRSIPYGTCIEVAQLRNDIAHKHGADGMCPLTAGIFIRIVSEVALEKMSNGKTQVTPFWRVVDPTSPLAKKISCGPETIKQLRLSEIGKQ